MNRRKLLQRIMASPTNVRFADMTNLVEGFGFTLIRISGSHHIFSQHGVEEIVNIQPKGRVAKPYQVKQVRDMMLKYHLGEEAND